MIGSDGPGTRGMALPEALVGMVVALLVLLVALVAVERLLADLRRFDSLAERQAGARLALARMQREVANAGLAVDPDGDPGRPDEAIEVALDWALVVRGDRDGTGDAARVPERELETSGRFGRVTTGNDEIVGFALGSPSSRDVLVFQADVAAHRRDGVVDRVRLARVARAPAHPPYTLYRVGLARDGRAHRRALLDGVAGLRFRYFDAAGEEIAPPAGSEVDESPAGRRRRAAVRRVRIELSLAALATGPGLVISLDVTPPNPALLASEPGR